MRLLKLPDEIKEALTTGEITAGHARAILGLQSSGRAKEILEAIRKDKLSVRRTEKLVQKISTDKEDKDRAVEFDETDFYINHITDELIKTLGTKVKIIDKEGKGKIEIEYYSRTELERLIEILTKY